MTYDAPAPYYGAQPEPQRRSSTMAIIALVLGILAVLTCLTVIGGILLGLVAIVLGVLASGRAKRGEAEGRPMAIIGIVLGVLGVVLSGVLLAVGLSFLNSDTGKSLTDCLQKAGSDKAAQEQCRRDANKKLQN